MGLSQKQKDWILKTTHSSAILLRDWARWNHLSREEKAGAYTSLGLQELQKGHKVKNFWKAAWIVAICDEKGAKNETANEDFLLNIRSEKTYLKNEKGKETLVW